LAPNQGRPYLAKARVLLAQEKNEAAFAAMKTALKYDPKNPFILMDLGDVSLRLLDRPGEALEFYLQANELDPTLVPVYLRLADVYVRQKKPEPAHRALDQARTLEPGNQMIPLIEERLVKLESSNATE
jgi:tetratricopeptide (TPR) repeat protein